MVRGPANNPKDGIIALDGIIETDWAPSTFTMNWRFTRACTVEFVRGEPICLFFPIQRKIIEVFDGEVIMLEANPELGRNFRQWAASRDRFLLVADFNDLFHGHEDFFDEVAHFFGLDALLDALFDLLFLSGQSMDDEPLALHDLELE